MSERKKPWTPGPWKTTHWVTQPNNRTRPAVSAKGVTVAITHPAPICQMEECEANARLIAASTELVEVLEEAIEWDSHDSEGVPAVWLDKAEALLAKIYGDET